MCYELTKRYKPQIRRLLIFAARQKADSKGSADGTAKSGRLDAGGSIWRGNVTRWGGGMFMLSAIVQKMSRRQRGSVLIMTLLVLLVLLLLGISYLAIIRRDYRFAAINERTEQAWFLAKAGLEYYRSESAADLLKKRNIKLPGTPSGKRLASGALPKDSNTHFFEVIQLKNGDIAVRGVVVGTMTSYGKKQSVIERTIIVPAGGMEASYDVSCFADVK